MDRKLRVGIIGSGNISRAHMNGYKAIPDLVDVVACCDIDGPKAKAYAENWGIPSWYDNCREMLEKENLDAVSVCTWNAAHKECTIAALEAGCNVLCEKPMAMNTAEALEMEATAKRTGKLLQIGFVRRYGNDAEVIKDFIEAGTMGDIYFAKATYLRRSGCPGGWFGDKSYSGGGPLIDLGVHVIDLTRYLAGRPQPVSVYGVTYNNLGDNRANNKVDLRPNNLGIEFKYTVEDFATAFIRFDNGMTLNVEASFNLNIKHNTGNVELFGTKAGCKLDPDVEFFADMNRKFVDIKPTGNIAFGSEAFPREIAHFVDCVRNGTPCIAPAEDGVTLMKILDAIYESAATGHEVRIEN